MYVFGYRALVRVPRYVQHSPNEAYRYQEITEVEWIGFDRSMRHGFCFTLTHTQALDHPTGRLAMAHALAHVGILFFAFSVWELT